MKLFVFGIGYTAGHYLRAAGPGITAHGTVRDPDKARVLAQDGWPAAVFDGDHADPSIAPAVAAADLLLVSVQPGRDGDPVLQRFGEAIAHAPHLSHIVYLSTVGVYGDHGGAWIDETTPPAPLNARGHARLGVEQAWLETGRRSGKTVTILRLAGIYGPGRNALDDLRCGEARRIDKPGQVFNRIHVADIGRAIRQAFAYRGNSAVWNIADDEPAPAPDVVAYAAGLLGMEPPPLVPFAEAPLSPMARSFYAANRRVANRAMTTGLGVRLAYPTFRHGLRALWNAGEGRDRTDR